MTKRSVKPTFSIRPTKSGNWTCHMGRVSCGTYPTQERAVKAAENLGMGNCFIKIYNKQNKLRRHYELTERSYTYRYDIFVNK